MIAGTLARLADPADALLEDYHNGGFRALDVSDTQERLDGRHVQAGMAAGQVETTLQKVHLDGSDIETSQEEVLETVATEWVADVTGTGLLVAESTAAEEPYPFPFDLFATRTGRDVDLLEIDVPRLHATWAGEDALGDVWMTAAGDDDRTAIDYHDAASSASEPTIGLGFKRPWNGTVERGVVYASGYVAVYSTSTASTFVEFVESELLPFASVYTGEDESDQQTLGESGTDGRADA